MNTSRIVPHAASGPPKETKSTAPTAMTLSLIHILASIEAALEKGDVEAAKDIARNTRGPVASIYYQGLMRIDQGIDVVEKL